MARVRAVFSWLFVRGPAAASELADSGLFGAGLLAAMGLLTALGAGIGALVGVLTGGSVGDAAFVGAGIGLGAVIAWLLLVMVVVAILWIRGVSPAAIATGRKPGGKHAAAGYGWRRPGQPLVPGSLVAFFALMAVATGVDGGWSWHESRPRSEPTATVEGTVIEEREPAWFSKGSGSVVVRYVVGGVDHTIETGRDPGDHFLRTGDVVPVEYVVARPADGRSTWAVESARWDARFGLTIAGICAGLGLVSGLGYLTGRWRRSFRTSPSQ